MPDIFGVPDQGQRRDRPQPGLKGSAGAPDFGSFMQQIFPDAASRAQNAGFIRRDYETALTLLQRASEAFPALLRHCQHLEAELRHVRSESASELQTAASETQQWQQVAVAMKMHIEEYEHQIATLRKRLAVAEERVLSGQEMAAVAEKQASVAIGITTLFHDKIVEAFGVGSPAHITLDAVAQGTFRSNASAPDRD